jgi:outer membrane protein OmpA-like peptidoglycan-associated protein
MPISPDVPAYVNYIVVIVSGLVVAISTVNTLLSDLPDRWAFSRTWILTFAHIAIPPLLFWFLDYTDAAHDTSLFVALVVGFGYRQVFAGGVQGINLSGQTPALWKPFEAWVQRVKDGIVIKNKEYRDKFDTRSRRQIASEEARIEQLAALAPVHSSNAVTLNANVNAARALFAGTHLNTVLTDLLWDDLRQSKPKRYAYILRDAGLVPAWKVWWWFDNGRSRIVISSVLLACFLIVLYAGPLGLSNREPLLLQYNQWRVVKLHATERDRFRSVHYMDSHLSKLEAATTDPKQQLADTIGRLITELKFVDLPEVTAERIVALVLRSGLAIRDDGTVRELIAALWTDNGAVRARINRGLVQIQKKAYADHPLPDGLSTAPQSGEAFEAIDQRVRLWLDWWVNRLQPINAPSPPQTQPPIVRGVIQGRYIVEVSFKFNSADVPEELKGDLKSLATLLKENAGWHLRVEGHTDSIGSAADNLDLSLRRAAAISRFLTDEQGVPSAQLTVKAMGESDPRAPNDTEEGRQKNRRVELLRTDGEFGKVTSS